MTTTPRGAPELASAQAVPETTVNEQVRRTEGGAGRYPIADRVTAPPGSCTNGAQYIIIATATGAFAGKEGQIAQAVGTNAANGWYYRVLGTIDEGIVAYVQDEDAEYKWNGSTWALYGGSAYAPGGADVALADGGTGASLSDPNADRILFWDDSAGNVDWLTVGTGLSITTTTLSATASAPTESFVIACSDETTALVAGTALVTFRMPYAFTLTGVRASLTGAAASGTITIDINEAGSTILSTKITIDATEETSTTAATPPVISDTALADAAEITIDLDDDADGTAAGLKVYLIGHQ